MNERLIFIDIQPRACNLSALQRRHQRRLVYHRSPPPVDPGPNVSIFQNVLVPRLRPAAAPLPSSASTQNPPSFHPERRECLSPLRLASCTLLRRCCRIPPPRSPRCAVSAPPSTIPH